MERDQEKDHIDVNSIFCCRKNCSNGGEDLKMQMTKFCCFTPGGNSRKSVSNPAKLLLKIQDSVAAELF